MGTMGSHYIRIEDIEIKSEEDLDILIEKAKELYLWKREARVIKKSDDDIDLEKIFENESAAKKGDNKEEFVSV